MRVVTLKTLIESKKFGTVFQFVGDLEGSTLECISYMLVRDGLLDMYTSWSVFTPDHGLLNQKVLIVKE